MDWKTFDSYVLLIGLFVAMVTMLCDESAR